MSKNSDTLGGKLIVAVVAAVVGAGAAFWFGKVAYEGRQNPSQLIWCWTLNSPRNEETRKLLRDWMRKNELRGVPTATFLHDPQYSELREKLIEEYKIKPINNCSD